MKCRPGAAVAVSLLPSWPWCWSQACWRPPAAAALPHRPAWGRPLRAGGASFDRDFGITNKAIQAINAVHLKSPDKAIVSLTQTFRLKDGGERFYDYDAVYLLRNGQWKDSDYAFDKLRRDGVIVRHWRRPTLAQAALEEVLKNLAWLKQAFGWQPKSEVVIKIYPEHTPFLYSIKPSLPTWVAGWDEAGESIKFYAPRDDAHLRAGVLLHETTHHMLSGLSNDNAAYWLQEGLASWAVEAEKGGAATRPAGNRLDGAMPRWTLPQLEALDLESMQGEGVSAYSPSPCWWSAT